MKCTFYKKFQIGRIGSREYRIHEQNCPTCRDIHAQDQQLLRASRKLKSPVNTARLWDELESRLRTENETNTLPNEGRIRLKVPLRLNPVLKAAAFVVGVVLLALLLWNLPAKKSPGLLSSQALKRVEKTERAYIAAITELEKQAGNRLGAMDMELALLYRDRLETIDEQIQHCRNALARNPANHQVRRYLLAALQDKNDTLREIVVFGSESS